MEMLDVIYKIAIVVLKLFDTVYTVYTVYRNKKSAATAPNSDGDVIK